MVRDLYWKIYVIARCVISFTYLIKLILFITIVTQRNSIILFVPYIWDVGPPNLINETKFKKKIKKTKPKSFVIAGLRGMNLVALE